jgi:hypothetical protein
MSEQEIDEAVPASEEPIVDNGQDVQPEEQKTVPLAALEAERRKRQDLEVQNRFYQDQFEKLKSEEAAEEEAAEEETLVNVKEFKLQQQAAKREIREEVFRDMNPKAMEQIKQFLNPILEKKPWLADSIKGSENRYARAAEIVDDYRHLVEPKSNLKTGNEGARIVQNANKPGSPITSGKTAPTSNMAYLKSIQGTSEFREYRQKVMSGQL